MAGPLSKCLREPVISFLFWMNYLPGCETFCELEQILYHKTKKIALRNNTFSMDDNNRHEVDLNAETFTFAFLFLMSRIVVNGHSIV